MFYICLHGATKWGSLTLLGNWSVTFELAVEELELGSPRRVEIYRLGNGSKRLAESWRRENSFTAGATMPKSKNDKSSDKLLIAGPGGATHQAASSAQGSLTTNQGVVVADNQNTLKSGQRGPVCHIHGYRGSLARGTGNAHRDGGVPGRQHCPCPGAAQRGRRRVQYLGS